MDKDWLIVGGGIHGVHIAARLIAEAGVAPDRLLIVDPAERLLERWRVCAAVTGMSFLRSPTVHHLDLSPWSLRRFADNVDQPKSELYAPPYDRPSLALFNAHCEWVIERLGLGERHDRGRVTACDVSHAGVHVRVADGRELFARHVVLAIGASEQPSWPRWAPRDEPRVQHVFAPGFDGWPSTREQVAVVGGGISAGLVALRLAREGHRVHLVSRHALREHQFDSDPGWLGPLHMTGFSQERDYDLRRAMIVRARHRGSVPPDVRAPLRRAFDHGHIRWHRAQVHEVVERRGSARLRLDNDVLEVERVLLATGFITARPGGAMIDELVASASLPCARCGFPIVDSALRWHPRIHVTGPLAELELGPSSRNIAGARSAGDRLINSLRTQSIWSSLRPSRWSRSVST